MQEVRIGLPAVAFADAARFETWLEAWLEAHGLNAPRLWLKLAKKNAPEPRVARKFRDVTP